MVLFAFPDRCELVKCDLWWIGRFASFIGVVTVELEYRFVGDGAVLYYAQPPFLVPECNECG